MTFVTAFTKGLAKLGLHDLHAVYRAAPPIQRRCFSAFVGTEQTERCDITAPTSSTILPLYAYTRLSTTMHNSQTRPQPKLAISYGQEKIKLDNNNLLNIKS